MRRVLCLAAAMTLGGCQCFDAAFKAYCDAGRCAAPGPVATLSDGPVRGCIQGAVDFNDRDGVPTEVGMGFLTIESPTGAQIFDIAEDCDAGPRTLFGLHEPVRRVEFRARAETFGVHSLETRFPNLPSGYGIFTANANLVWVPMVTQIPKDSCEPIGQLEARGPVDDQPVRSQLDSLIVLETSGGTFGRDAANCNLPSGSVLYLPMNATSVTVFMRTALDAGDETLVVAEADSVTGLLGRPQLRVYSTCRRIGASCDPTKSECCSGNCTGICQQ